MNDHIRVSDIEARSPHNEGLYEAGKTLLVDSVEVGRDFCKSMMSVATGAIPVYIALVGLVVGEKFRPNLSQGIVLTLAPGAFLLALIAFAIGYFPTGLTFSLDIPDQIERARSATIRKRLHWSFIGLGLLVLGILLSIIGIYYGLTVASDP